MNLNSRNLIASALLALTAAGLSLLWFGRVA